MAAQQASMVTQQNQGSYQREQNKAYRKYENRREQLPAN